jgi:CheY-like chemotaxis protein/glycine cleavage system H lipoate-binding protein
MVADPTLLVVDDEEVICQGCRRVLSRQGFQVETANEADVGLTLASERDYDVILLDITMPSMDGIEFLEELRKTKPDVPVIFITGNPTVSNAASAVRLHAADYITKPFTPEAIVQSVRRHVRPRSAVAAAAPAQTATPQPPAETWTPRTDGLRFWDETWMQADEGNEMRVGAVLGRLADKQVKSVRLPKIGETVYQGLPMAGLVLTDGSIKTIPAPVSGVVTTVNSVLADYPEQVFAPSYRTNWIALVTPTRLDDERGQCRYRRVVLLNNDAAAVKRQSQSLTALGCQVINGTEWSEDLLRGQGPSDSVVIINAATFGDDGPELVEKVAAADPGAKVVVLANGDPQLESAYRRRGIFYYALDPFTDGEIVEILDGAFRQSRGKPVKPDTAHGLPNAISKITITNRSGNRVCLMVDSGAVQKDQGLGQQLGRALAERLFPVEVTLGSSGITPIRVLKATGANQRVIALLVRDSGRLPGAMVQHKGDFVFVTGPDAARVTTFVIQPDVSRPGPLKLDERTTAALADTIVEYMAKA